MNKNRQMLAGILCLMMVFTGCKSKSISGASSASPSASSSSVRTTAMKGDVYSSFTSSISNRVTTDNYTVAVSNTYQMTYSDDTMDAYDMDGVLQMAGDTASISQNIDSNGLRSTFSGNWYGNRLYNSYNGITYYEDMDADKLKTSLLVPLDPLALDQSMIDKITGTTDKDGNVSYTITIAQDSLSSLFEQRYDQYGLNQYDGLEVKDGTITDTFDSQGHFTGESVQFDTVVTLSGQQVDTLYKSQVTYSQFDTTSVTISDDQKAAEAQYVSYQNIDTDSIQTLSDDDDSAESTVTATFQKRLTGRLNYTVDGSKYTSTFNDDNESYMIDFDQHIFEYSNRTIHYIYNWVSDTETMGACTANFTDNTQSSDCQDSTVDTMKQVKQWFEMELYYCGLTLDDLVAESK
ncbi:MAG: hypothetical protein LKE61_12080 [Erysipelotrichaceae bacterium]|jgi:hypothetical protein|nr:hypothetical protein [Erysipelotrichaceae bacterium]MCH4043392.1 hypothetical protein [Erysipelotrichaceae bacterium]MCI1362767.1 hypothetical protein [Solobacterium sp.]